MTDVDIVAPDPADARLALRTSGVLAEFNGADWVSRMLNPKPLRAGERIRLSLDMSQAHLFDAATGKTLRS